AAAAAAAVAPFDFDTTPGRLPKTVVPTDYVIALTPDAAAKTLRGTEHVTLDVRRPTKQIVFNTHDMTISDARLDGARVARTLTQNDKQLTTLTLARPAAAGRHVLTLAYSGKIEDSPDGLFAQDYRTPDGRTGRMLSTQFESTDARRMFPAWDEPAFRATYQLTVTLPAVWSAVSNMPVATRRVHGNMATTAFARTPKMPSYLVVLTAGDLASISGVGSDGVKQSIWAIKGDEQNGRYALDSALKILPYYDDYFGVKFPLPKLDHIAIPGGFGGAMENWGGITYNESIIIHRPNATLASKQSGFSTIAHEMAHQWNGDLVTMGWWDDIWLNESFASWMAAKATDKFNPDWNWAQGEDASKQSAMNADARSTSHAIQQHVVDELQADASFDPEITYDKGQAFLRMLEAYLGEDTFRSGIRTYMRSHEYGNATTADLWIALGAASKKDVSALAKAWTEQPGFPLVSVTAACDAAGNRTVTLAQKRFLLDGTTDTANSRWNVPVAFASGSAAPAYVLLTSAQQSEIPAGRCSEPLRANAGGVGYYRVAYDAATFETNRAAFAALPDADKIAMLGDQWNLVRIGAAPLPSFLALANAMGTNRNTRAWRDIVGSLAELETGTRGIAQHDAFTAYARSIVAPLVASLGWDAKPGETVATGQLRRTSIAALGAWGDPATIAEARIRFDRAVSDPASTPPDMAAILTGIVATNADAAAFDRLHELAQAAKDPTIASRYRGALMHVRDPKLAARALDITISTEIPPQQESSRLGYVISAADWNPKLAWTFFQAHSTELTKRFSLFEKMLGLSNFVPAAFWDATTPDQIEAWLKTNLPTRANEYIAKGMSRAKTDGAIRERLREDVRGFLATPLHTTPVSYPPN
ncbi:MAG: M1 family metallopeptidase, partial [Candidatus Eremiobacteraeota bacterium]|nr:M1 family metallopeptidase [Candidatus Eremiobacteraeota bacterium]